MDSPAKAQVKEKKEKKEDVFQKKTTTRK